MVSRCTVKELSYKGSIWENVDIKGGKVRVSTLKVPKFVPDELTVYVRDYLYITTSLYSPFSEEVRSSSSVQSSMPLIYLCVYTCTRVRTCVHVMC